jgi:hypothetical protein
MRVATIAWIAGVLAVAGAATCAITPRDADFSGRDLDDENAGLEDDPDVRDGPAFDASAASRLCGDFEVNDSSAAFRLAIVAPGDSEAWLGDLHPSYAAALAANRSATAVLPSLNALDGKAKQFDDGLVAALDQAYFKGLEGHLTSHVALVRRILDRVGPSNPAAPFLAAALDLAGTPTQVTNDAAMRQLRDEFLADELRSKPIAFYSWNETLVRSFRIVRFLGTDLQCNDPVAAALADALAGDEALRRDYDRAVAFYARLTNPPAARSMTHLAGAKPDDPAAFLPSASMREDDLFARLFPHGIPPNAGLMRELIHRVRAGEVDLTPRADGGWYDRQTYARETLLLTDKSEERAKVAFNASYKRRLLSAFAALLTKRRETHAAHKSVLSLSEPGPSLPTPEIRPHLRLEPCLSYYLRTARAYGFLADFLESAVGAAGLRALHGLREGGERPPDLATELQSMRELFYGCYLVGAEDLGMKPRLAPDEPVDVARCREAALAWIAHAYDDPDLAADTRVCVPIASDPNRGITRLWSTLGVRLLKLRVDYSGRYPHYRRAGSGDSWAGFDSDTRSSSPPMPASAEYLILVDDFAEIELPRLGTLTRAEFRAVCDRERTHEAIVEALQAPQRD